MLYEQAEQKCASIAWTSNSAPLAQRILEIGPETTNIVQHSKAIGYQRKDSEFDAAHERKRDH